MGVLVGIFLGWYIVSNVLRPRVSRAIIAQINEVVR
jgi:hypothetical protein